MLMKWSENGLKSPLARARGLGSAKDGVHHWIMERVTAVIAVFLLAWMMWSFVNMGDWSYDHFAGWLARPVNAVLMLLAVITVFYHTALGVQVILEDYVHAESWKFVSLCLNYILYFSAALACVFAILKIAFTHQG